MTTLNIAGKNVTVSDDFLKLSPEQQNATVDEIAGKLGTAPAQPGARPSEQPSTAMDMLNSGVSGLRQGVEGAIGGFGDVGQYQKGIAEWGAGKLGLSPETGKSIGNVAQYLTPFPAAPTTQDIQAGTDKVAGPAYVPQTTAGKFAHTVASFAPALLGGEASIPTRLVKQVLLPGIASEGAGEVAQSVAPAAEPYARIVGALLGGAAPSVVKRAISPLPISQERQALVDTLHNEGVNLTAGQTSGRNALRYAESELGGGAAGNMMERQGEQFTAAALRRAGIDANRATPEVIDGAFTRIGQQFDDLAARNRLVPDQQMIGDLRNTISEYGNLVPESARAPIVENLTNDIVSTIRANGQIAGASYQALTSRIARASRGTKDPELGSALRGIRETLDGAMERSIQASNPADTGAWQEARTQYRNLLTIEKAATGAGENAAQGLISPSQLRNATVQQGRRAYARGQGDFADLARAGEGIMKPLPQSGSAPRAAVRGVFSTMGGIAGAAGGGGVAGGVAGALLGAGLPALTGRALLSAPVRAYLGNQAASGLTGANPRVAAVVAALLGSQRQRALPPK